MAPRRAHPDRNPNPRVAPRRASSSSPPGPTPTPCPTLTLAPTWFQGEPCVDEWYGVLCCPQSHPRLRCADTEACNAAHAEADECVDEAGNVWGAVISRAGSISYGLRHDDISPVRDDEGGAEDAAARRLQGDGVVGHDAPPARRALAPAPSALALTLGERACGRIDPTVGEPATCVVVGLRLGDNNLEGTLAFGAMAGDANGEAADGLCALTHLQLLSVAGEGNRLRRPAYGEWRRRARGRLSRLAARPRHQPESHRWAAAALGSTRRLVAHPSPRPAHQRSGLRGRPAMDGTLL